MADQQDINNQKEFNEELSITEKLLQEIQKNSDGASDTFTDLSQSFKAILSDLTGQRSLFQGITKSFKELTNIADQFRNDELGITQLSEQQLEKLKERGAQTVYNLAQQQKAIETQLQDLDETDKKYAKLQERNEVITAELKDANSSLSVFNELVDQRIKDEQRIVESLGIAGTLTKGIEKTLKGIGFNNLANKLGLDEANAKMREIAEEATKGGQKTATFGDKLNVLGGGLTSVFTSIAKNLFDPSVLVGGAVNLVLKLDTSTANLAKNLNISFKEAKSLNTELKSAAAASGDIFITSKGLAESLSFINQTLGVRANINNEDLITFTKLRATAGLTNEELLGITQLTAANGGNLRQNTDELLLQISALNEASGIQVNEKDILKDIGQISAATTLSLGKNPRLLADAAQTAKRLGLELSQVESIADSLLNFESSITNELEAEVLLGRDLNLERARLAALNNDIATVAREISSQVGDAAEFSRLNRIQQEALAQSVGMSREDLAQQLFVQEQLLGLSEDEAANRERLLNARIEEVGLEQAQREGIETLEQQASIQERINASVTKLSTAFDGVAVALLPILDIFSSILSLAGKILQVVEPIIAGIGSVVGKVLGGIGNVIGGTIGGDLALNPDVALAEGGIVTKPTRALIGEAGAEAVIPLEGNQMIGADMKETNALLQTLVSQNSKKPELSPVGLYEIQ